MTIAIPCHLQLSVTLRRDKGAMLDVGIIIAKVVDDIIVFCSFHNLDYTPHLGLEPHANLIDRPSLSP